MAFGAGKNRSGANSSPNKQSFLGRSKARAKRVGRGALMTSLGFAGGYMLALGLTQYDEETFGFGGGNVVSLTSSPNSGRELCVSLGSPITNYMPERDQTTATVRLERKFLRLPNNLLEGQLSKINGPAGKVCYTGFDKVSEIVPPSQGDANTDNDS